MNNRILKWIFSTENGKSNGLFRLYLNPYPWILEKKFKSRDRHRAPFEEKMVTVPKMAYIFVQHGIFTLILAYAIWNLQKKTRIRVKPGYVYYTLCSATPLEILVLNFRSKFLNGQISAKSVVRSLFFKKWKNVIFRYN